MVKVKWNRIPRIFKHADVHFNRDGSIAFVEVGCHEGLADRIVHRDLVPEEYEVDLSKKPNVSYMMLQSREEWEREQWRYAPEWATAHMADIHGVGRWCERMPMDSGFATGGKTEPSGICFQYGETPYESRRSGCRECPKTLPDETIVEALGTPDNHFTAAPPAEDSITQDYRKIAEQIEIDRSIPVPPDTRPVTREEFEDLRRRVSCCEGFLPG